MAVGRFFSLQPPCPKWPRTSFPFYKFFYPTISARISDDNQAEGRCVIFLFFAIKEGKHLRIKLEYSRELSIQPYHVIHVKNTNENVLSVR